MECQRYKKISTLNNRRKNLVIYYNFNQNLEAPNVEKTQVTKSRFTLLRATFAYWLPGNQRATDLFLFNKEQWQKCWAVTTDALQVLDRTYLQTSGIAHIPPGWTVPYGLSPAFTETKLTQFSEPKLKWKANRYFLVGTTQSCYLFSYQKKPPLEFEEKIFSPRSPPYFRMHSSQPLFFFWLSG